MKQYESLTIYFDETLHSQNINLFNIFETLKKEYSFLSFVSVGPRNNIEKEISKTLSAINKTDLANCGRVNKTHVLFSQNDTGLIYWEKIGGKSIKYNLEPHNRYGGIIITPESDIAIIKRYLNLY